MVLMGRVEPTSHRVATQPETTVTTMPLGMGVTRVTLVRTVVLVVAMMVVVIPEAVMEEMVVQYLEEVVTAMMAMMMMMMMVMITMRIKQMTTISPEVERRLKPTMKTIVKLTRITMMLPT